MKNNFLLVLILVLAACGMIVSLLTIQEHLLIYSGSALGVNLTSGFCSISEGLNCEKVLASPWSTILGFPIGIFGFLYFFVIGLTATLSFNERFIRLDKSKELLAIFTFSGVVASCALFLISKFEVGTLCPLCVTVYVITALLFMSAVAVSGPRFFLAALVGGIGDLFAFPKVFFGLGSSAHPATSSVVRWSTILFLAAIIAVFSVQSIIEDNVVKPRLQSALDARKEEQSQKVKIESLLDGSVFGDYFTGPLDAPITLIEFSDFECSACQRMHESLKPVLQKYEGKVLFVLRNYPLDNACNSMIPKPFHRHACFAAELARCVGEQGQFWKFADYLFESGAFDEADPRTALMEGVNRLNLDSEAVNECMTSGRQKKRIIQDIDEGNGLKLGGTPSLFVNGMAIENATPGRLERIFEAILEASSN